jgi:predicted ATPase/class 3 adenylate cyclase
MIDAQRTNQNSRLPNRSILQGWSTFAFQRVESDPAMSLAEHVVTHLFTDLEGSTRLWEKDPARMEQALRRHDDQARSAVERCGGRVVKSTGDGIHAVFDDPSQAVDATVAFLAGLDGLSRETGVMLRARCGIHAGIAAARDGDYYGAAVNRAARIMSAAHGGQVLLSEAAALLVRDRLHEGAGLLPIGRVRLKDLAASEPIYQLTHPKLKDRFPPPRSLDHTPNNLAQQVNSFVGREGAMAELRTLLHRHRMITLAGPGGVGKSRLAVQLAAEAIDEFPDGVWLVELAPLADAKLVPRTVAHVLAIGDDATTSSTQAIADFLRNRQCLLILDNCEHLPDACAEVANAALRAAPGTRLLATSRELLRVDGECRYEVMPLRLPDESRTDVAAARQSAAVSMLLDRAREQVPKFELTAQNVDAVVTICRQLDGIPLALELAAARVRSLTVEEIARRLRDRFRFLTSGTRTAMPRHRSLLALIAWSYDLLSEDERRLLERLSVFAGSFDLPAAAAVSEFGALAGAPVAEMLWSVVDKSLAIALPAPPAGGSGGEPRYRLLETIRAFARERLKERSDEPEAQRRHVAYFLDLAVQADQEIRGPRKPYWCARLDLEHDNLRAAMAHARGSGGDPDAALRFGVKLGAFWRFRGHATEGRAYLRAVLGHPDVSRFAMSHAGALLQSGILASFQGDSAEARDFGRKALTLYRAIGRPMEEASTLIMLGAAAQYSGDFEDALACHEQALAIARAQSALALQVICFVNLGNTALLRGDAKAARDYLGQALDMIERSGESTAGVYALEMLGQIHLREGALPAARERFRSASGIAQRMGDVMQQAKMAIWLGRVAVETGDMTDGVAQLAEGLRQMHRLALKEETLLALDLSAEALHRLGDSIAAAELRAAAGASRAAFKFHWPPLDRAVAERDARAAAAAVGAEALAAATSRGAARPLADAVEFALDRLRLQSARVADLSR